MLRRIGIGIAVIIVIIVVAAAVAPYFVGRATESNFKAQVAYINAKYGNRGIIWHVDSYHRGWYSSDADISVTAAPGAATADVAKVWKALLGNNGKPEFHLHINHGPVPFDAFGYGHWNFFPVLYTAEFRGKNLPAKSIVGALKPDLYVVQYFTGSMHDRLTIPSGTFSQGVKVKARWEGGHATGKAPEQIVLIGSKVKARWEGGHATGVLNGAHNRVHYTGSFGKIDITEQHIGEKAYGFTFDGMSFSGTRTKAANDFWTGKDHISSKGMTGGKEGEARWSVSPWTYDGTTHETSDGRWIGGSVHYDQTGGSVKGWRWTGFKFDGSLVKLNARALRKVITLLHAAAPDAAYTPFLLVSALPKAIAPETHGSFNLTLTAPDGDANMSGDVRFNLPIPPAASVNPAVAVEQRANLRLDVNFDRKLVDDFNVKVLGAPTSQSVNQALQAWTARGFLQEQAGGHYHTQILYRGGKLTVNGKAVSIPAHAA